MLNNQDFISLERRLWREGNPLCDELVSTRDTLLALIKEAKAVMEYYKPALDELAEKHGFDKDNYHLEFYRLWDNFGDTLDNISYDLGVDSETQYKLHEVTR